MCLQCRGETTIAETIPISIELRKGAADPRRFVIENVTDSSELMDAGNLDIAVESQFNPFFARRLYDIIGRIRLTDHDFRLGYKDIILPTGEEHRIDVVAGQAAVTLEGKGVPFENSDRVGNLILHFG
jgi:DnaJ-class molecular chaperone